MESWVSGRGCQHWAASAGRPRHSVPPCADASVARWRVHRDRMSRPAAWARLGSGAQASSPLRAAFTRPPPTLILAGEADESNYRQLTAALTAAATAGDEWLLVDLASLTYCDLAGLRAIVSLPTWHRPAPESRARPKRAPTPAAAVTGPEIARPEITVRRVVLRDASRPVRDALRILGWDETPGVTLESPS